MIYRCILPDWAKAEFPDRRKVLEGEFSKDQLLEFNEQYYSIFYFPNCPSTYEAGITVDGSHIDTFNYVFVDMDLKEQKYPDKQTFIDLVMKSPATPTMVIDSGNGVHAYWQVSDLDAINFLKLQRRLMRHFNTDEAVSKICQLMRETGYVNTKHKDNFKMCDILSQNDSIYSCEDLDSFLSPLTNEDETYCKQHYEKTYNLHANIEIDDRLPPKFEQLIRNSQEVKDIWCGNTDDRSGADFRLGHLMFAHGFTKAEAMSVLVNSAKALSRAPVHKISYASGIVDKIWTYELSSDKTELALSASVKDILSRNDSEEKLKGKRFPCHTYLDATEHGFRLGQVVGLVAGSGVGKTAMALNMFMGFVQNNPDYYHFFVPLEQPANEIADRWRTMCGDKIHLHEKVHVISNYDEIGAFRHLSFDEIKEYLLLFQEKTGHKVGCVVIDHIGALKKKDKNGENQDLMNICHAMKAFAVHTNTLLVMQSQAPREKAGIGDLELNKDAAYGTVYFESYCDYLITIWQPLKRCYATEGCPTVTAFKFCKIRHKKQKLDKIQEDVPHLLYFESDKEYLRRLTEVEEKSVSFYNQQAVNKRKGDGKTDIVQYKNIDWIKEGGAENGKVNNSGNASTA